MNHKKVSKPRVRLTIKDYLVAGSKTQKQFAGELGITPEALSRLIRGKSNPFGLLYDIADKLSIYDIRKLLKLIGKD